MPHSTCLVYSFNENLSPITQYISTKHSAHLEVADLLAKGFPHMQVGNGVVKDSLHDAVERRKGCALLSSHCQLGWQNASMERP